MMMLLINRQRPKDSNNSITITINSAAYSFLSLESNSYFLQETRLFRVSSKTINTKLLVDVCNSLFPRRQTSNVLIRNSLKASLLHSHLYDLIQNEFRHTITRRHNQYESMISSKLASLSSTSSGILLHRIATIIELGRRGGQSRHCVDLKSPQSSPLVSPHLRCNSPPFLDH